MLVAGVQPLYLCGRRIVRRSLSRKYAGVLDQGALFMKGRPRPPVVAEPKVRVNQRIRAPRVRVIAPDYQVLLTNAARYFVAPGVQVWRPRNLSPPKKLRTGS